MGSDNRFQSYISIGAVMVSLLVSSAVDHGFESRSGQPKDYKIGIWCFSEWGDLSTHIASTIKIQLSVFV